jgi:hypothetical protein
MKGFFLVVFACYTSFAIAQCGVQVTTTPVICNGQCNGTATAYPFGGIPPYSYQWGNGDTTQTASGFCAGTYLVSITDSVGCQATGFFTIQTPPPLVVFYSVTPASCSNCCDGSITPNVAGGTGSVTYSWTGPNGYTSTQANITGLCVGTYTLCVTDANGCTSCSSAIVNFTTSAESISESGGVLSIMPNPANVSCTVQVEFAAPQHGMICISTCQGQLLGEIPFETTESLNQEIDLSSLANGIYVISVNSDCGNAKQLVIVQ